MNNSESNMEDPTATRRRGRPARLSREEILDAALDMLRQGPFEELTMSALARHLSVSPMSLYTYLDSHQDLLTGVSDLILGMLEVRSDPTANWQQQLRDWLQAVYSHLREHPYCLRLIDSQSTVGARWLTIEAELIRILMRSGLSGEDLAYSVRWVAQAAPAALLLNPALDSSDRGVERKSMTRVMDGLTKEDATVLEAILPHIAGQGADSTFAFYTERVIDSVEALVESRS